MEMFNVEVTEVESRRDWTGCSWRQCEVYRKSGSLLSSGTGGLKDQANWSLWKKISKNVARPLDSGEQAARAWATSIRRATGTLRTPNLAKGAPLTPPPGGRVWAKPSPEAGRSFSIGALIGGVIPT